MERVKQWNIVLECENQKDAAQCLKQLVLAFELADEINEPLNGFFMESSFVKVDCKKVKGSKIINYKYDKRV